MTPEVHAFVLARDGGCVARFSRDPLDRMRWPMMAALPDPGPCRNEFGSEINPYSLIGLTLDHVEEADQLDFGRRPPDDPEHLWTLCPGHHMGSQGGHVWATDARVRDAARSYIPAANAMARQRGWPAWPSGGEEEAGAQRL